MKETALLYSENEFGKVDGKVANGLVRQSDKYAIIGVIDSKLAGKDAGHFLDGITNQIQIFRNIEHALSQLDSIPEHFIYGLAPLESELEEAEREVIFEAIRAGMNIVNGLPQFLSDDITFSEYAGKYNIRIHDVRKPPAKRDLHMFSGKINTITTPIVSVLGTDCATGKRTTAMLLLNALQQKGLNAVFIATGQTGILQGAKYGVAIDMLSSGFATGEIEHAIVSAVEQEHPDIIVVEGQGSLGHPAFTSTCAILRGARPDAIIIQHPPKRKSYCDYPHIPLTTLKSEIQLIEGFADTEVIAVTINHENMTDLEISETITTYEYKYCLPTTDVLKHGCDKLITKLLTVFPELKSQESLVC